MIIAQVCLRLATIKGQSKMCSFTVLGGGGGSENQSVSAVCHLPCTVKTRIHPWREHLSIVPDAIECEHLLISWYATSVRWMIISFTKTDLDRFVNNIWEKSAFCVQRKSLRSLSSAHEKWGQKQKCCVYNVGQCKYMFFFFRKSVCLIFPVCVLIKMYYQC